jgi:glycosyltransferase involved in cell wall biosynthesis
MASGRPVIVSNKVGGARDLVTPGVTGWVFESGNRDELAAAVEKAFGCDNETLHGMAEAARRESARWSIEAAAQGIERAVVEFTGASHDQAVPLQGRHIRSR